MKSSLQFILYSLFIFTACSSPSSTEQSTRSAESESASAPKTRVEVKLADFKNSSDSAFQAGGETLKVSEQGWVSFAVDFPVAGRYEVAVSGSGSGTVWVEDYIDNKDGRTYNVTGDIVVENENNFYAVEGSPFNRGMHKMKLHYDGEMTLTTLRFSLMKAHRTTPNMLTQNMEGGEWEIVWADEFDGEFLDTTKWTYDFGNWGWGNNELQYYTDNRKENTRLENGMLIIEARKNDMGEKWTSARLTTREKTSFLYGKIEFKAKVPKEKGNWAAGWTLGDSYVDELSWPYCGEIDIMESVGYEVNDTTGDGISHATVHTPAYYFKIGNQISSTLEVEDISEEFHTYAVVWTPKEIRAYVDDEEYYLYDKTANEKEWPFNQAQNIILNLAMGGGWGGAMGMDSTVTSQKLYVDYVRVYGKK